MKNDSLENWKKYFFISTVLGKIFLSNFSLIEFFCYCESYKYHSILARNVLTNHWLVTKEYKETDISNFSGCKVIFVFSFTDRPCE